MTEPRILTRDQLAAAILACDWHTVDTHDEALRARVEALEAVLRFVEWSGYSETDEPCCPCCGFLQSDYRHADTCELSAALPPADAPPRLSEAEVLELRDRLADIAGTAVMICDSGNSEHGRLAMCDNSPFIGECRIALERIAALFPSGETPKET